LPPATGRRWTIWGVDLAADDGVLGFDPADYAEPPLPPLPDRGTPERARFDRDQAAMVAGLLHVARMRPVSWDDPAALPSRGCFCSRCNGQLWRCEREAPRGWSCTACLPPSGSDPVRLIDTRKRGR
jgi:hypothetical protein